jgi:hypothetical protein
MTTEHESSRAGLVMVNTNARKQNDEPCHTGCPALLLHFEETRGWLRTPKRPRP